MVQKCRSHETVNLHDTITIQINLLWKEAVTYKHFTVVLTTNVLVTIKQFYNKVTLSILQTNKC